MSTPKSITKVLGQPERFDKNVERKLRLEDEQ
jgi:hypothetical protein